MPIPSCRSEDLKKIPKRLGPGGLRQDRHIESNTSFIALPKNRSRSAIRSKSGYFADDYTDYQRSAAKGEERQLS